ncbi:hypothetical protein ROA7450_00301 [Roseovarius albus]|uniref:Uncharacterized protein n=1 Tax=Roseovarius albus TaxID=1247867 RepID=A0A1X6Y9H6_9RHOB|nr:hypothetical protein [Roseovarius albus]SLN14773.1 hypothetical protein ROA7450_00301 [Roseovarius albus]
MMPAAAESMKDCTYRANIHQKTAVIEVAGGEPVSYRWGSYNVNDVYKKGTTIYIDQAKLTDLRVGTTENGKPAFSGRWRYKGSDKPTTFVCK